MPATIIAEIGCNHQGSMEKAKDLIDKAAMARADIVKFQKRENRLLLTPEEFDAPHPVPANSFGDTYGAHREFLEFTIQQHHHLKGYCETKGIEYSTSVWDKHAAWEIKQIKPKHIKIPSACNMDMEIYDELEDWEGTLHVSLGMTLPHEYDAIVARMVHSHRKWKPVFYACTSGYPVAPNECYLKDIEELRHDLWSGFDVGYSGHHVGTNIDVAAYALGASFIERHFTFDKSAKGTDHSASLNVIELMELRSRLDEVHDALHRKYYLPEVENVQRAKLKRKVRD